MMKHLYYSILILTITLFISSCAKDSETQDSINDANSPLGFTSITFGAYWGECIGDCAHLYKYDGEGVYKDEINNIFELTENSFSSESLEGILDETLLIASAIPQEIITLENEESNSAHSITYGCPDCLDQGALYLQLVQGDIIKVVMMDPAIVDHMERTGEEYTDEMIEFIQLFDKTLSDIIF